MVIKILLAALGAFAVTAVFYLIFYRRRQQDSDSASESGSSQLNWHADINSALLQARAENKLVLVDVYAKWCGWCKQLAKETLTDKKVVAFLSSRFALVKLDAEDGAEGQSFARKQSVRGYPTIIVLDPYGKRLGSFSGYRSPSDFPGAVNNAAAGKKED